MNIQYKPTFFDDLDEIKEYIEGNFDIALAIAVVQRIHADCLSLATHPYLGREYPRNPYYRYLIVQKKNLVFYHIDEQGQVVTLHRVFDGRRDYADAVSSAAE